MTVERISEPRGPFGGVTADGMVNVLGRPRLDSLELVIREAAQNAWDARARPSDANPVPSAPAFSVRIRELTRDQEVVFRELFADPATHVEVGATNELWKLLATHEPIRVLELCDFGTSGLTGPIDQHAPATGNDNFRNFFFDVGVEHFTSGDGGTYGYGRSALYLAGSARTIVVDSLTATPTAHERRFMASRVGHPSERRDFSGRVTRFTGRHFWGIKRPDHGGVEPLTGTSAEAFSDGLGMPRRDRNSSGTSILIPWPASDGTDASRIDGQRIWDAILCHLWPKLVSKTGPLAMQVSVEDDGKVVAAPDVHQHRVYGMFASALLVARDRSGATGARSIALQRPSVVTGHLGLEIGGAAPDTTFASDEYRRQFVAFQDGVYHVALMRPSELVVRYLEIPDARQDGRQWAGVFICANEPDIRDAFARSEPPAHDDWVPDRLDDKRARRLVHQTVARYIPDAVRAAFDTGVHSSEMSEDLPSLARAADAFAREFLIGDGTAPASGTRKAGPGSSRRRSLRIGRPTLVQLGFENQARIATYRLEVSGVQSAGVTIRTAATIAVDGGAAADMPFGLDPPDVLGWRLSLGDTRRPGLIHLTGDQDVFIDIAFRGLYGIAVVCSVDTAS